MDFDGKALFASRTFWGVAISVAAKVAAICGVEITDEIQGQAVDLALLGVSFVGDALALYGRATATKAITKVM